jgi:hypothetical protein
MVGELLALNLLLSILAFLAAVAKKYSTLSDDVDKAGAAAIAVTMAAGVVIASATYNEPLFVVLGLALFVVEAIWFASCGGER